MIKNNPHRQIIYWLLSGCFLIYIMLVVGCITRLTHSGLSITDWSVMGSMPPISEESWMEHFSRYQQSPEFKIINSSMTLAEFKHIFWWEWTHRFIGRIIGLVFFAGFTYFVITKKFTPKLLRKAVILLCVGALQGLVGWWMVKSGLVKNPHVSHYRLATHLITALTAFGFAWWFALELIYERDEAYIIQNDGRKIFRIAWPAFTALLIQLVFGAFVAGLKAGLIYPTWPKMGNEWFPGESILVSNSLVHDFTATPAGTQFIHRTFAWVVVALVVALFYRSRKINISIYQQKAIKWIILLIFLQVLLGILTLLFLVPVCLGVLHQTVAFFLVAAFLYLLFHSVGKKIA